MYSCRLLSAFIGLHCILILYHVYISPLAIYISDTPLIGVCGVPHIHLPTTTSTSIY